MRHFHSLSGNNVEQYGWKTGCVKVVMLAIRLCSDSSSGLHVHPRGLMSSKPAPSRNPHVCTPLDSTS